MKTFDVSVQFNSEANMWYSKISRATKTIH